MHIVMLSDVETHGGAAIATSRLALALGRFGHRVTRLVATPDGQQYAWRLGVLRPPFSPAHRIVRRLLPVFERDQWDACFVPMMLRRLKMLLAHVQPDVINLHNLHAAVANGWSPAFMRVCADQAPTVWTLHDMWSFTGRCACSYDCRKFISGCDPTCPTPREHPILAPKRIASAWGQRHRLLKEHPSVVAVTPSQWLAQEAKAGLWTNHRVDVIPNGLRLEVYQPADRLEARHALGLQTPQPVLLVAASNWDERRSGGDILVQALSRMAHRSCMLVVLGAGNLSLDMTGVQVQMLGYISDERRKVLAYNAADIVVHPAPVGNLPNVVMEAIACGTPVVGLPIGGVPEMVRSGRTGWLADSTSPEALAKAIDRALDALDRGSDLRLSCRDVAEAEYRVEVQAQRYIARFQSLIDQSVLSKMDVEAGL